MLIPSWPVLAGWISERRDAARDEHGREHPFGSCYLLARCQARGLAVRGFLLVPSTSPTDPADAARAIHCSSFFGSVQPSIIARSSAVAERPRVPRNISRALRSPSAWSAALLPSGPDDGHRGRLIAGHQRQEGVQSSAVMAIGFVGASRQVMAIGHLPAVLRDRDGHHRGGRGRRTSAMGRGRWDQRSRLSASMTRATTSRSTSFRFFLAVSRSAAAARRSMSRMAPRVAS